MRTPLTENTFPAFKAVGLDPEKALDFVEMEDVVNVVTMLAVNERVHGRIFSIWPEPWGVKDMNDDEDGGWGEPVMKEVLASRRRHGLLPPRM